MILGRHTIGIIGAGNMGQALLRGLMRAGAPRRQVFIVESDPGAARRAGRMFGVHAVGVEDLVERCDAIILAVKPQDLKPVLELVAHAATMQRRKPLLLSIAAGVPLSVLQRHAPGLPVVRLMPNLPAKIGSGVTALAGGRLAGRVHRSLAHAIFSSVGVVVHVPERMFDVVTAISGSGPAYFFLMFKALRDAGVRAGLPAPVAQQLAVRTALGSAQLVEETHADLGVLIKQVASKKGTTEAALRVFARKDLSGIIGAGVAAAAKRSRELSQGEV
jgi:pyrroline-5-carboxylate reductase